MKTKNLILKLLLWIIAIIMLYVLSFFVFKNSVLNYTQEFVFYTQENTLDYKVYLKDNDFFETDYLEKDKVYITTLIKHIDVDYGYKINFDQPMSGSYKYTIKALMSADKEMGSNTNYWQKEYKLYESELINYENLSYINFEPDDIVLNYDYYNDLLVKFKNEYKLSLYGNLKLIIEVQNYPVSKLGNDYKVISVSTLDIPLTQATIEIPIKANSSNRSAALESSIIYDNSPKFLVMKICGAISFIIASALAIILVTKIVRTREKPSAYNKTIKKILKTYDEIIVNINSLDLSDYNVVEVNDFNELIDAHGEVRQPINFVETRKDASFILINDKIAWKYNIKRGNTL